MNKIRIAVAVALAAALTVILSGCEEAPAAQGIAPQPPAVPVAAAVARSVELGASYTGRVEAVQRVEVRPRVAGTLQDVLFEEGALVSPGQVLFRIDPRPFDAAVLRAEAELAHAKARLVLAASEAARAERLASAQAVSREEMERRRGAHLEAAARVQAAQAALDAARLDREFADVRAPIAGRASRAHITRGNLVAAGLGQPALTTIVSIDRLFVSFDVNEADAAARAAARTGLMPGMFTRVALVPAERTEAILIDDAAIGTDQGRRFVLVAGKDDRLEYRPIRVGPLAEGLRVVEDGLAAGERIVVSGLMKVRPGATIRPQLVAMDGRSRAGEAAHAGGNDRTRNPG